MGVIVAHVRAAMKCPNRNDGGVYIYFVRVRNAGECFYRVQIAQRAQRTWQLDYKNAISSTAFVLVPPSVVRSVSPGTSANMPIIRRVRTCVHIEITV